VPVPSLLLHRTGPQVSLFVDLDTGIFNRLAVGRRASNKRQTTGSLAQPAACPSEAIGRDGNRQSHFVEWNGKSVASVKTGFASAVCGLRVLT